MCLGVVGEVTTTWDEGGMPMATVDTSTGTVSACLMYVPDAMPGEIVLVHLGFAVDRLAPDEATAARELRRGVPPPFPPPGRAS